MARRLDHLPSAGQAERASLQTLETVRERIAENPSRLALPSECRRQLLAPTAVTLGAEHRVAILDFLIRP